jgi:hypothetical protein
MNKQLLLQLRDQERQLKQVKRSRQEDRVKFQQLIK